MKRVISVVVATAMLVIGLVAGALSVAGADPGPQVCSGTHLTPQGSTQSVTYTAPEGMLVAGYCVKAGSAQQGNGPHYETVDPPRPVVTIFHPSGKDISHFSVRLVPIETEPTEEPTPTDPPTSEPPVVTEPPVTETPSQPIPTQPSDIGTPLVIEVPKDGKPKHHTPAPTPPVEHAPLPNTGA